MTARKSHSKIDLYADHRGEYTATPTPRLVRLPPAKYLAIEGEGAPGSAEFQARLQALYSVGFTLKFQQKAKGRDFRMLMLEGLYDLPTTSTATGTGVPTKWTLLLRMPGFVRTAHVKAAVQALREKGKPETVEAVRLLGLTEGRSVQMLHVGAYSAEHGSVATLAEFATGQHLELRGPHHEIYVSDPRRVPETRLRTILRYPVAAAA